jgi:hypothetical protein
MAGMYFGRYIIIRETGEIRKIKFINKTKVKASEEMPYVFKIKTGVNLHRNNYYLQVAIGVDSTQMLKDDVREREGRSKKKTKNAGMNDEAVDEEIDVIMRDVLNSRVSGDGEPNNAISGDGEPNTVVLNDIASDVVVSGDSVSSDSVPGDRTSNDIYSDRELFKQSMIELGYKTNKDHNLSGGEARKKASPYIFRPCLICDTEDVVRRFNVLDDKMKKIKLCSKLIEQICERQLEEKQIYDYVITPFELFN